MSDSDRPMWLYVLDEDIAVQRVLAEGLVQHQKFTEKKDANVLVRGFTMASHFWQRFNPQEPSAVVLGRFETPHVRWNVRGQFVRRFPAVPVVYLGTFGLEEEDKLGHKSLTWEWPVSQVRLSFLLNELFIRIKREWKYSHIEVVRQAQLTQLTPREREILGHLLLGRSMSVIAKELRIDEKTAWGHRGRAMAKLGLSRDPHWAQWIWEAGGLPKMR